MCYVMLDDGTVKNGFNLFDNSRQYLLSALELIRKSKLIEYRYDFPVERPTLPCSELENFRFTWQPLKTFMVVQDKRELHSKEAPVTLSVVGFNSELNRWFLQGRFGHGGAVPVTFDNHQLLDFHGYFQIDEKEPLGKGYLTVHMTA